MSSKLWLKGGIYDPSKRFSFTNITDKPFTFRWDSKPITVKAGETVELRHHLAVLATTQLVDQIMSEDIHAEEEKVRKEKNDPYWRSPRAMSMAIAQQREVWEDKVLKELPARTDNDAQFQVIRAEAREQLVRDMGAEPAAAITRISVDPKEFEEVNLPK